MSESHRKLAAIMFTDIVGYTALMGRDEGKALQLLHKNRDLIKPLVEDHDGEWLKEIGDVHSSQLGLASPRATPDADWFML